MRFLALFLFLILVVGQPLIALGIDDDLVLHYRFSRFTGAIVWDYSLNQNHGMRGNTDIVRAKRGFGLEFHGVGSRGFIEVPDVDDDLDLADFTLMAWVRIDTYGPTSFAVKGGTGEDFVVNDNYGFGLLSDGRLVCGYEVMNSSSLEENVFSSVPVPLDELVHVACTFDSSTGYLRIFQNGVEVGSSVANNRTPQVQDMPVWFGSNRRLDNQTLDGVLDEIMIWRIGLPANRIASFANR